MLVLLYLTGTLASKLVGVIEVCRHGARSPWDLLPWNQKYWSEVGQLTSVGMRQHWLIGYEFRRRYIVNERLIPPFYNSSNVYLRSTDYHRTIQSAESQLQGLFPEGPSLRVTTQNALALPPIGIQNLTDILDVLGDSAVASNF